MEKEVRKICTLVTLKQSKASLVLKNAFVVNVFTGEIVKADVAIENRYIAGIGEFSGLTELDYTNKYILPGFIDAHLHLESSLVTPGEFVSSALQCGTTTYIVDPHESANVAGSAGINYILDQTYNLPANVFVMMPSCVPSVEFELNGCEFTSENMKAYINNPRILGLGEVMDFHSVINNDNKMADKLALFADRIIDGHAPGLSEDQLAAYAMAGISSDHECPDYNYAKMVRRNGEHILIREGSVARNLTDIVSGIVRNGDDTNGFSFCTDDKHIDDIVREGHINYCMKRAVELGVEPINAVQMATINTARHYRLKELGAVAPGYLADIVVVDDLTDFNVVDVFHSGKKIKWTTPTIVLCNPALKSTMNIGSFDAEKLKMPAEDESSVIELRPGQIANLHIHARLPQQDGYFVPNSEFNKVAVVERHHATGDVGLCAVKGFGIRGGAIATSVSHDSHNIIAIGDNDADIELAITKLAKYQGGYIIVSNGEILDVLPLPIMGLMSECGYEAVSTQLQEMKATSHRLGVNEDIDPFFSLSFFALPVIPELRVTPLGLFDVVKNEFC